MAFDCNSTDFVEKHRDLVITQYRESENLRFLIDEYLAQLALVIDTLCSVATAFETATIGQPLTVIGEILGWPRVHCSAVKQPVFGFDVAGQCCMLGLELEGFCENGPNVNFRCECRPALGTYEFTDDALYSRFLNAKIESHRADFTHEGIGRAVDILFGTTNTIVATGIDATVNIYTGRVLITEELSLSNLFRDVLPVAPGLATNFWQTDGNPPFGFGAGWGEFCTSNWAQRIHNY